MFSFFLGTLYMEHFKDWKYWAKVHSIESLKDLCKVMYLSTSVAIISLMERRLNYDVFLSMKIVLILANSNYPDEMQYTKCPFRGVKYTKG